MSLFILVAVMGCSEPPVPPPPPEPIEAAAPRQAPTVTCEPALLPERSTTRSVIRLNLSDGHSMEIGPIDGTCTAIMEPDALCAVQCGTGSDQQVYKAAWDGVRLAVWRREQTEAGGWSRFWTETGPAVPR